MVDTNSKKMKEIIDSRYIERIFPSKEQLKKELRKGKRLTLYIGVDPTDPKLHLGHSTNFFLLKKFQELGHQVIFLIGDFTAQIGDPAGRLTARKDLSRKEILENCKDYKSQVGKILDFNSKKNPVKLEFNSKWYKSFSLKDTIELMAKTTYGKLIKRAMFQNRIREKKEIHFHELFYPLLQGYDSVVLKADIEVGGNDQTFNMLIGRDLVRDYQKREKFVITTKLLINPKTQRKLMSKSEGGFVALNDPSIEIYGKIMALPDEVIIVCFELCTEIPQEKLKKIKKELKEKKINPKDLKAELAREVVKLYHGEREALSAEKEFNRIFREKKLPSKIPIFKTSKKVLNILDLIFESGLASSKSQAKRLVLEKGVKIDRKLKTNWREIIKLRDGMILQVGRRGFKKIKL